MLRANYKALVLLPAILTGFVAFSALLGILFAPSNAGKTLEELEHEQTGGGRRFVREPASSRQPVA